jgi:hypothetical protein
LKAGENSGCGKGLTARATKEGKTLKDQIKKWMPWAIAMAVFVAMVNLYPPGSAGVFTWSRWLHEDSPSLVKISFVVRVYLRPAALAFAWIAGFQLQMRLSAQGAKIGWMFVIVYASSAAMMAAWRSLAAGPSVLPAYAMGVAIAQTMASRVYAVTRPERNLLGMRFRTYKVIWIGDQKGVTEVRAKMALGRELLASGSVPPSKC